MKTRSLILSLLALTAAVAVAGCGGSSKASGIVAAPSAGATQASVPTTPKPPPALAKKPTVTVPTGPAPAKLVTKDLVVGTGQTVKAGQTVTVNYVGVLYKGGKQFDASWNDGSGQPVQFSLAGGVIKGWTEGIPGMRVGGRRELIIPPNLAYGKKGSPPKIPPNSTLVFVIDLHAAS